MLFEGYIQNLTKKQTLQLYILIAIFILYPYFQLINFDSNSVDKNKNIMQLQANIIKMDKKLKNPNLMDVLKDFEKKASLFDSLKINDFKLNKKTITLTGKSNQNDLLRFLLYCENYNYTSSLDSLSIKHTKNKKLFSFSFDIKFKNNYSKKLSPNQLHKQYEKISLLDVKKTQNFKLQGIVEDFVIIDNNLLSKGDKYGTYEIEQINKDSVIISNSNIKKTLYLKKSSDAK